MTQGNCGADERRGRPDPGHHQLNLADLPSNPSRVLCNNEPVQRKSVIWMHFEKYIYILYHISTKYYPFGYSDY